MYNRVYWQGVSSQYLVHSSYVVDFHVLSSSEAHLPSILVRIRFVALAHPSHVMPTLNTVVSLCVAHENIDEQDGGQ